MTTKALANFLLARTAEDKADAVELARQYERWQREWERNGADGSQGSIVASLLNPGRILAECEVKRQIVESCIKVIEDLDGYFATLGVPEVPLLAAHHLALLALPYTGHPDYRVEWKP